MTIPGMTLRDYFVSQALRAMFLHGGMGSVEKNVLMAYAYADQILVRRTLEHAKQIPSVDEIASALQEEVNFLKGKLFRAQKDLRMIYNYCHSRSAPAGTDNYEIGIPSACREIERMVGPGSSDGGANA